MKTASEMAGDERQYRGAGHITSGIATDTLITQALTFVRLHLPAWRDDPDRRTEEAEERLNAQLAKFLNARARRDFPMAYFHHEEHQGARRRVDLSVLPTESSLIGAMTYSVYDPFLVIEGKRLPAPSVDREIEYVTGNDRRTGGIQRFKLGLHGGALDVAGMVGYVQGRSVGDWHQQINSWITDLASGRRQDVCLWEANETLGPLEVNEASGASYCASGHGRASPGSRGVIRLHHLWVVMRGAAASQGTGPGGS
jgi:hypothetical protein